MSKYLLNPRIAADLFDDDFILANLDTGIYYSLTGLAVFLITKLPIENQKEEFYKISLLFPEQQYEVISDLSAIWHNLINEEIIISRDTLTKDQKSYDFPKPSIFVASKLSKYADMQDLLMLDPIHEVDEDGWAVQDQDSKKPDELL